MSKKGIFSKLSIFISSKVEFCQIKWRSFKRIVKLNIKKLGESKPVLFVKNLYHNFQIKVLKSDQLKNHVLTRYLFKDLFLYFIVAFLFFFMIFFVNQILLTVESLLAKSAPFADVMRIMFYSLPFVIAQSAPFATLVGFLLSLGGMVTNNEILIFRASGFSFKRILWPILVLGMIISVVSFFVNDYLLPLGTMKYNQLMREIMNAKPSIELESNSVKTIDSSHIVIGGVLENEVSDMVIFDTEGSNDRIIVAGNSQLLGGNEPGVLMQFKMDDSMIMSVDYSNPHNYDVLSAKQMTYNVFDSAVLGVFNQSPREMTAYDLANTIEQMKVEVEYDETMEYRLNLWIMEFHKKFALPFASIFFAFLAFSIAFLFKKHNSQTLGLFIGIIICVVYWAMQILGQLFVTKIGLNAFLCIWVPNILLSIFGFIFSFKLLRK